MKQPTVSVIVPVYRVEAYLDTCVQSICAQSFADFELILVDDGSPDRCPALCDGWAEKDARIRVIHQKNGGLSAARNAGIDAARGEYLAFVDSDDYIEPDMLDRLVEAARKTSADLTICSLRYEDDLGIACRYPDFSRMPDRVIGREEFWKGYFSDYSVYYVVAWNKLYRRNLFDTLRYAVGRRHEDEYILRDLIDGCDTICCLGYVGYHYVQRSGSITSGGKNAEYLDYWEVHLLRAEQLCTREHAPQAEGALQNVLLGLWQRQAFFAAEPDQRKRFRSLVRRCSCVYARLARVTGQKSMLLRALLLRIGLNRYIAFLQKRHPELFIPQAEESVCAVFRQALARTADASRRFILMQTPLHGNLGDHAIALAEQKFLADRFPGIPVIELPGLAFSRQPQAFRELLDSTRDTILITGGGFAGSLQEDGRCIQSILSLPGGFRILVFPQTLYFEEEDSPDASASIRGYADCDTLTFCARDLPTLERLHRLLPGTRSELIPDMVLYDPYAVSGSSRRGVGLCLRRDRESSLDEEERQSLARSILRSFPQEAPVWTDTVVPGDIAPRQREQKVREKLDEFAGYRFVVTDRLHGMMFAALTGTPCIVLDNCDHKVRGGYEWLKQNPYLLYLDNLSGLPAALQRVGSMLSEPHCCDLSPIRPRFDRLAELLMP